MEHIRLFVAVLLCFLILLTWELVFIDKRPVEDISQVTQPVTTTTLPKQVQPTDRIEPVQAEVASARGYQEYTIHTPLYSLVISEKGAVIKHFLLKNYRETIQPDSPLKELVSSIESGTVISDFSEHSIPGMAQAPFLAQLESGPINITDNIRDVAFRWTTPNGVLIEKIYSFDPASYLIGLTVTIQNESEFSINDHLTLTLKSTLPQTSNQYGFEGPSALISDSLEQIKIKDIQKQKNNNEYSGKLKWIAIQDRYFLEAIVMKETIDAKMKLNIGEDNLLQNTLVCPKVSVAPGTQQSVSFQLFFGPKSLKILNQLNNRLNLVVDFGWFDILAKPSLWFMNYLYQYIPNYGIAIIILTLVVKILMFPLGTKSYKSMNDMKKLQPLMTEIREKYKDDKKKMNEELMNLYKVYKINPMGGCLPMVIQLPVFIALYRMLYEAIELRHAPFFGWIKDLSAPDRLFNFNFSIPFMEPPYGIPVLTIIMGASMLLQQKMTPAPGDPTQAKMMMLMPVVFTVIFINFSSGLVLYWLISNILSMAQQYYISKKFA